MRPAMVQSSLNETEHAASSRFVQGLGTLGTHALPEPPSTLATSSVSRLRTGGLPDDVRCLRGGCPYRDFLDGYSAVDHLLFEK